MYAIRSYYVELIDRRGFRTNGQLALHRARAQLAEFGKRRFGARRLAYQRVEQRAVERFVVAALAKQGERGIDA